MLLPLFVTAFLKDKKMQLLPILDGNRHSYLDYAMSVIGDYNRGQKLFEKRKALRNASLSIINESNLTGGENVGGSTAAPAAPEVAGDDDDGDGDGDPDPDRQPRRRSTRITTQRRSTRSTAPLPPAQLSRPKAACALLGIGRTKLHHLSERDPRFPRKIVLGPRCVGWRTDALLDYLRLCEQEG